MIWQAALANLVWSAPLWGWGLAALALPIAAHLMAKWGGRLAVFPAVRFVQRASADASRVDRPRHLLLWLLRTLILVLVIAAFAQPVWHGTAIAAGDGSPLAIVVDRSASMNRTVRGVSLLEDAKAQAIQAIEASAGRPVVLVLADAQPAATMPEPSRNADTLVAQLQEAPATWHRADLDRAVAVARETLARGPERIDPTRAEIVVLTDTAGIVEEIRGVSVRRVEGPTHNVSLSSPRIVPNPPIVGQPAAVGVVATNHGQSSVSVEIEMVSDTSTKRRVVSLDAEQQASISFTLNPSVAGTQTITFRHRTDDALSVDDRVGLVTRVEPARPVILVTRANPDDPQSTAYFLKRALAPDRTGAAAGIDLRVVDPDDLVSPPVGRDWPAGSGIPRVYIVAEAGALNGEAIAFLRQGAASGDGLLWVADSAAAGSGLETLGDASPLRFAPQPERQRQRLAYGDFGHAVLSVFDGASRSTLLGVDLLTSPMTARTGTDVLLIAQDNTPVLGVSSIEDGRIAILNTDLSPDTTPWVKSPSFVALLHQLVRTLAPGEPTPANPRPGAIGDTASPGPAAVEGVERWIELDPRESDLATAVHEVDTTDTPAPTETEESVSIMRSTVLWPWLIGAAVLLLMAESGVLGWNGGGRG